MKDFAYLPVHMKEMLSKKMSELDAFRPFSAFLEKSLDDWTRIELTYTDSALEDEQSLMLTRNEAREISRGYRFCPKERYPLVKARNHVKTWDWLRQKVKKNKIVTLIDEKLICDINARLFEGIEEWQAYAGVYRNSKVRVRGSWFIPPNYIKVPQLVRSFVSLLHKQSMHPVELAVFAHFKLVSIHPFHDGNGRTSRLLMNMILEMYDFPPCIIENSKREEYYKVLERCQTFSNNKGYDEFLYFIYDRILDVFDSYQFQIRNSMVKR